MRQPFSRRRGWAFLCVIALMVAATVVYFGRGTPESSAASSTKQPTVVIPSPGDIDAIKVSKDLKDVTRVWGEAGGTWAFPFWEKAYRRWRDHNINDSTFREYVIAYREQLDPGCDVLDGLKMSTDPGNQVADLAVAACKSRLRALRDLRQLLDLNIEHQGDAKGTANDPDTTDEMHVLDTSFQTNLQNSYYATRIAMNGAQELLKVAKKPALPQDAML